VGQGPSLLDLPLRFVPIDLENTSSLQPGWEAIPEVGWSPTDEAPSLLRFIAPPRASKCLSPDCFLCKWTETIIRVPEVRVLPSYAMTIQTGKGYGLGGGSTQLAVQGAPAGRDFSVASVRRYCKPPSSSTPTKRAKRYRLLGCGSRFSETGLKLPHVSTQDCGSEPEHSRGEAIPTCASEIVSAQARKGNSTAGA
jgi:hypothetical protein